ncbi:hypothetical protein BC828DRAFT_373043 [Blastocladiella britannica]|nr:hypothetical protein BC828DRAFT_373043 [Blastocladiella britannica]
MQPRAPVSARAVGHAARWSLAVSPHFASSTRNAQASFNGSIFWNGTVPTSPLRPRRRHYASTSSTEPKDAPNDTHTKETRALVVTPPPAPAPSTFSPSLAPNPIALEDFFVSNPPLPPPAAPAASSPLKFSHELPLLVAKDSGPAKIITTDYRIPSLSKVNEDRGASSTWDPMLRRCTNPVQLRVTVSRILAQSRAPAQEDVIAALNACARLALLGWKGVAPIMDRYAHGSGYSDSSLLMEDTPTTAAAAIAAGAASVSAAPASGKQSNSKRTTTTPTTTSSSSSLAVVRSQQYQRDAFAVAQSILRTLADRGVIPSRNIYSAYIRVCAHAGQVDAAFTALDDMKRNGLIPDTEIYKGLVMASARMGDLPRALATVESSVQSANSLSKHAKWLKMALRMAVGIEAGKWLGILLTMTTGVHEVASQVIGIGFGTVFGLRLAIPVLVPWSKVNSHHHHHDFSASAPPPPPPPPLPLDGSAPPARSTNPPPVFESTAAFRAVPQNAVFHSLDAEEVAEHMHNFLVRVLEESGNVDGALSALDEARERGVAVTVQTYNQLVSDLVDLGKADVALATIAKMTRVVPTVATFFPLLRYHYDRGEFANTVRVYETHMAPRRTALDLVAFTCLISAYGKVNDVAAAQQMYDAFLLAGLRPNQFVLNTMISIFAKNRMFRDAEEILLDTMPKYGVQPTVRSFAKLIDKAKHIDTATYVAPTATAVSFVPPPLPGSSSSVISNGGGLGGDDAVTWPATAPVQVERAWFWFFKLRASGLAYDMVTVRFLMQVLTMHGYPLAALHIYAEELRTGSPTTASPVDSTASSAQSPPPLPPRTGFSDPIDERALLLANNPMIGTRRPNVADYWQLSFAAATLCNVNYNNNGSSVNQTSPLPFTTASLVAILYEIKARHAWHIPLPDPRACPEVARLVHYVVAQQHTDSALDARWRDPSRARVLARRSGIMLSEISLVAAVDPRASVELKELVVAACDLFRETTTRFVPSATAPVSRVITAPAPRHVKPLVVPDDAVVEPSSLVDDLTNRSTSRSQTAPAPSVMDDDDDDEQVLGLSDAVTLAPFSPPRTAAVPAGPIELPATNELEMDTVYFRGLRDLRSQIRAVASSSTALSSSSPSGAEAWKPPASSFSPKPTPAQNQPPNTKRRPVRPSSAQARPKRPLSVQDALKKRPVPANNTTTGAATPTMGAKGGFWAAVEASKPMPPTSNK